jgi:hypothetical protein
MPLSVPERTIDADQYRVSCPNTLSVRTVLGQLRSTSREKYRGLRSWKCSFSVNSNIIVPYRIPQSPFHFTAHDSMS